mmetsp:Transcript_33195/g.50870  ORF Transcript_33195/g.50870 Transcript_33195/m.50870 type:complete len:81 (+) Transcript_33195:441-683(+)
MRFLNRHIQICEKNNKKEILPAEDVDSEIGIKVHFDKAYLDKVAGKDSTEHSLSLNISVGIYESYAALFYKMCQEYSYSP